MKKQYGYVQKNIKMIHEPNTRMCWTTGADELKISGQGRFKPKSFSQETGKEGQHQPRIGYRPQKSTVQDARLLLAHLPSLFFSNLKQSENLECIV